MSAPAAFGAAWRRMTALLFRPLRPGRYVAIAALGFLATLGEGGCGVRLSPPLEFEPGEVDALERLRIVREIRPWVEWFEAHAAEVVVGLLLLALVAALVGLLLALLRSFFRFVFYRTCVEGRLAVGAGLRRDAGRAIGLFLWDFCLGLLFALVVAGAIVAAVVVVAVVAVAAGSAGVDGEGAGNLGALVAVVVVLGLVLGLVAVGLLYVLVQMATRDLVVALAARTEVGILAGWRRLLGIFRRAPGESALYLLLRAMGGAAAAFVEWVVAFLLSLPFLVPFAVLAARGEGPSLRLVLVALLVGIPYVVVLQAVVAVVALPLRVWLRLAAPAWLEAVEGTAPAAAAPTGGFCGACGAPLRPEARFCGACGRPR